VKQPSCKAIYRLVGMDLFSTDNKAYHIAKTFSLPPTGAGRLCVVCVGARARVC
jgi:hypothetical protein